MVKPVNLERFRGRYRRANRKEKGRILSELSDLYHYNRKYLLQFFNYLNNRKGIKAGRKPIYSGKAELLEALKCLWLATDQLCGKRLKAAIIVWLPSYEITYGNWIPSEETIAFDQPGDD